MLTVAASVECRSSHPLANAILRKAKENNIPTGTELENFGEISGKGIIAKINGTQCYVGSSRFLKENNVAIDNFQDQIVALENDGNNNNTCWSR